MKRAKRLRKVIRDQATSPMDRAVWFVEHVARTLSWRRVNFIFTRNMELTFILLFSSLLLCWHTLLQK
jgi:hypothetical protein